MTVRGRCPAGFIDQRSNIFNLTLNGVRESVRTVASASSVVGVDRSERGDQAYQLSFTPGRTGSQSAVDYYQGRSLARCFVSDDRPVF